MVRDVCSLTSFIVSLLLAYRVGRVYDRWWAACNAFGSTGSGCVGLVRQAYTNIEDPYLQVGARGASGVVVCAGRVVCEGGPRCRESGMQRGAQDSSVLRGGIQGAPGVAVCAGGACKGACIRDVELVVVTFNW